MPLPYARSIAEEHLYMRLHPCRCGESQFANQHATIQTEQGLASEHYGSCVGCGQPRRFVFRLPGLAPQHTDRYGGPDPSQIIDAAEWRLVALAYVTYAHDVRDQPEEAREALMSALGAYQEMLKFIPAGEQHMPDSAFFTERGRRLRAGESPTVFTRTFLEVMVNGVRRDLAAIK
jgi:hypothetical protein